MHKGTTALPIFGSINRRYCSHTIRDFTRVSLRRGGLRVIYDLKVEFQPGEAFGACARVGIIRGAPEELGTVRGSKPRQFNSIYAAVRGAVLPSRVNCNYPSLTGDNDVCGPARFAQYSYLLCASATVKRTVELYRRADDYRDGSCLNGIKCITPLSPSPLFYIRSRKLYVQLHPCCTRLPLFRIVLSVDLFGPLFSSDDTSSLKIDCLSKIRNLHRSDRRSRQAARFFAFSFKLVPLIALC